MKKSVFLKNSFLALVVCSLALSAVSPAKAVERKFPHGCEPVGSRFEGGFLMLEPNVVAHPQTLFLMHNMTNTHLLLKRIPDGEQDLAPRYKSKIKSNQWAAFSIDQPRMRFACYEEAGDNALGQQVDCGTSLELCQYQCAVFGAGNNGNYWIVRSGEQKPVVREAIHQGILLRWSC